MKYKLLKDLPGYFVGAIVTDDELGLLKPLSEYPDWFQPLDDTPTRWRPVRPDTDYWSLDITLQPRIAPDFGSETDDELYRIGNFFRTEQQAQAAAEAIRAVLAYIQTPWGGYHGLDQAATPQWGSEPELAIIAARAAVQEGRE